MILRFGSVRSIRISSIGERSIASEVCKLNGAAITGWTSLPQSLIDVAVEQLIQEASKSYFQ